MYIYIYLNYLFFRPYQSPPPYAPYHLQRPVDAGDVPPIVQTYNQPPTLYPQQSMIIIPASRIFSRNQILTKITPNIRLFFIISGILYLIWSLAIIGIEITITIESYWSFYRSIWINVLILGTSIFMLIVTCRSSYSMITLIRLFSFCFFFCLLGVILSSINYANSEKCSLWSYSSKYRCDTILVNLLKLINMITYIIATIHTLINIIIFNRIHKNTLQSSIPNQ